MTAASPPKPWESTTATANSAAAEFLASSQQSETAAAAPPPPPPAASYQSPAMSSMMMNSASPYGALGGGAYGGAYGSGAYGTGYGGMYGGGVGGYGGYGSGYGGYGTGYGTGYGGAGMYGAGAGGGMYGGGLQTAGAPGNTPLPWLHQPLQVLSILLSTFGHITHLVDATLFTTSSTLNALTHLYTELRRVSSLATSGAASPSNAGDFAAAASSTFDKALSPGKRKQRGWFRWRYLAVALSLAVPYWLDRQKRRRQQQQPAEQQEPTPTTATPKTTTTTIEFAQALYDYQPPVDRQMHELPLVRGQIVALLAKPNTEWYQARTKEGRIGHVPANYIRALDKKVDVEV